MHRAMRWAWLAGLWGCGGDKDGYGYGTDYGGYYDTASGGLSTPPPPPPPPEDEIDLLLPPAQTDAYVFIANASRNTLTRVEVETLSVMTTAVGVSPELVMTTSDLLHVVVFNAGEDSVTILDTDTLQGPTVPVRPHLDAMSLSPDGLWAVLWHDSSDDAQDDGDDAEDGGGLLAFNEVSFVRTTDGAHFPMAVGFDPRMVRFTPNGDLAVIVSQAEIATIDLRASTLSPRLIELAPGVLEPPPAEEVILAADGSFAWVRAFGATSLLILDLASGERAEIPAGINPTDLDLTPDGLSAVAVARDSHELWIYEANSPFAPPTVLPLPEDAGYGSLLFSPDGAKAALYTTASPVERIGIWDIAEGTITERALVKPVAAVGITPTGQSMLVFHTLSDGPDTEPVFADAHALTMMDLEDYRSNPLLLPGAPIGYANSTTGLRGYFVMEGSPFFEVLDYVTLLHEQYTLSSIPEYVGVLPDLAPGDGDEPPAWVSQQYDLGRISFFDPDDASLETLTGFELNAGIEE